MAKRPPVTDVVEEIFQSILATPKRQRRLRSATFWDKFGFERRTKERVEQVREALRRRNLILSLEDANFGVEDKDEWVILSYIEPPAPIDMQAELSPVATQLQRTLGLQQWNSVFLRVNAKLNTTLSCLY